MSMVFCKITKVALDLTVRTTPPAPYSLSLPLSPVLHVVLSDTTRLTACSTTGTCSVATIRNYKRKWIWMTIKDHFENKYFSPRPLGDVYDTFQLHFIIDYFQLAHIEIKILKVWRFGQFYWWWFLLLSFADTKAPSTLIRFQTKTELFCSGYGYRPHYNAENDHRKGSHWKTLTIGFCSIEFGWIEHNLKNWVRFDLFD